MKNEEKNFITSTGFNAIVCANPAGHRCGYIVIPADHPVYKMEYSDINISVHGGLTFSELVDGEWVIGFDCAHYHDAKDWSIMDEKHKQVYGQFPPMFDGEGIIRTLDYCVNECEFMAAQLANYIGE